MNAARPGSGHGAAGENVMNRFLLRPHLWWLPVVVWGAVVGLSLAWNLNLLAQTTHDMAAARGRFVFSVVESMRLWNAQHGGVYARVEGDTVPNPYLEVPEREVTTVLQYLCKPDHF